MHEVFILLGSNILPAENLHKALAYLGEAGKIKAVSNIWETGPVGSSGPNFLNTAACLQTDYEAEALKWQVLRPIEAKMGRVRSEDKYAPRPIDLDILVFDGEVVDDNLWERFFAAIPLAELIPGLRHPQTGQLLKELTDKFKKTSPAFCRLDLSREIK
jgi:2-amino-4-hydroxy-6-hydroxymethyldihydropteridine diphosphokinase